MILSIFSGSQPGLTFRKPDDQIGDFDNLRLPKEPRLFLFDLRPSFALSGRLFSSVFVVTVTTRHELAFGAEVAFGVGDDKAFGSEG